MSRRRPGPASHDLRWRVRQSRCIGLSAQPQEIFLDTAAHFVFSFRSCPPRPPLLTYPHQAAPAACSRSSASSSTTASNSPPRSANAPSPTTPPTSSRTFGTSDLALILARIAQGLHRAGLLEEKIARTAARLDAEPQPKPAPSPRAPRALPCEAQPPSPRRAQPQQPADAASLLANLPTPDQIAAKVRRQPIGAVLADICRDLGI